MKKFFILALAALSVISCDFVRTIAGRPTSAQLETIRQEKIAAEEARHQAVLDSMERVRQHMADSLEALDRHLLDSLTQAKGTILNPSKLGGLYTTKLEAKYCIVVGAFKERRNAERKLQQCNDAGYTATIVSFRNGFNAVAICPSDSLNETLKTIKQIRGTGICPKDCWILINE